jgi:hypothetical protein
LAPIYVQGIESHLGEPVNCDDELLGSLFMLWQSLQAIETMRKMYRVTSAGSKKLLPGVIKLAEKALPQAIEACRKVDVLIGKLELFVG